MHCCLLSVQARVQTAGTGSYTSDGMATVSGVSDPYDVHIDRNTFTNDIGNNFRQTKDLKKLVSAYRSINHLLNENYDTSYIKEIPVNYILVLKSENYLDAYSVKNENQETFDFQSDLTYNAGVSFGYKIFVLDYSHNISNLLSPNSVKSSELGFTIPTNLLNVELSYFLNKGKTNLVGYHTPDTSASTNYSFEGLDTKILSVDVLYFVNHKHYSNNSAYSTTFGFKQQKSAGSFLTGLSYTRQDLFFDLSKLPVYLQPSSSTIFKGIYDTYSVQFGYGYNFVFYKHWLANLSVITKTGIKINEGTNSSDFNFSVKGKMAVAYNRPAFFTGINCDFTTNYNIITNSIGNFNIYIGFRF